MNPRSVAKAPADHPGAVAASGIAGLDNIILGGFPRNRIYLIEGDPGVGKTTLALQYLLEGIRRGERCFYITLSETNAELRAVADSHGWNLDQLPLFELSAVEEKLRADSDQSMFHPSEVELGETTRALLAEVERVNPSRVVFDSLSEIRLLARDPLRYRRQILALKQFFTGRQCTALLLDDCAGDSHDRQLQTIAHGVIQMQHLAPEYGAERRRLRVLKLRGTAFRGGFHDYNIRRGGLIVFPRLVAAEHRAGFDGERVSSGVPELDTLLGGGIDRGTSTLILGPAGCGKSTISAQFAIAAAERGERVAMYTFDEGLNTFIARNAALGMDVKPLLTKGAIQSEQVDPAELSPGEFSHRVRESVDKGKASMVVIDSLNGYMNAMPEERFLSIQMHELLSFLSQRGVTTLLICCQHGLTGPHANPPVDLSYLADTVVMLRYFETQGRIRKAISVIKKRSGPHENTVRELKIGPKRITVTEPLSHFSGVLAGAPNYEDGQELRSDART